MLDGRVSDLELGGILLAMRIKGEVSLKLMAFLMQSEIVCSYCQHRLPAPTRR